MGQLETFSTAGMEDPRRKLSFWNDIACNSFTPIVSDPADIRSFAGSLVRGRIGDMTVAEVFSEAQLVRHSRLHVARTRAAMFFLHLQVDGRSLNRQDGREAALTAGDFTLCDSGCAPTSTSPWSTHARSSSSEYRTRRCAVTSLRLNAWSQSACRARRA
jgi:hypothetical protein